MRERTTVSGNAEFAAWMDEHTWFEDAETVSFSASPGPSNAPCTVVKLVLAEMIKGTYVAGTRKELRDHVLAATLPNGLPQDVPFVAGNCCRGVNMLDAKDGIAFTIDVPGPLEIRCAALEIETSDVRTAIVRPWLSESELGATIPKTCVPAPDDWVRMFHSEGVDACWRTFGGAPEQAPRDATNYEGWFLQERARVGACDGGVFVFACRQRDENLVLQLQRRWRDDVSNELWTATKRAIAGFDASEVWCGNCRFSTAEWRTLLATGALPARLDSPET
jgi:hypothetical protein